MLDNIVDILTDFLKVKHEKLINDLFSSLCDENYRPYQDFINHVKYINKDKYTINVCYDNNTHDNPVNLDLSKVYGDFINLCYNTYEDDKSYLILLIMLNSIYNNVDNSEASNYLKKNIYESIKNYIINKLQIVFDEIYINETVIVLVYIDKIYNMQNKKHYIELNPFQTLFIIHLLSKYHYNNTEELTTNIDPFSFEEKLNYIKLNSDYIKQLDFCYLLVKNEDNFKNYIFVNLFNKLNDTDNILEENKRHPYLYNKAAFIEFILKICSIIKESSLVKDSLIEYIPYLRLIEYRIDDDSIASYETELMSSINDSSFKTSNILCKIIKFVNLTHEISMLPNERNSTFKMFKEKCIYGINKFIIRNIHFKIQYILSYIFKAYNYFNTVESILELLALRIKDAVEIVNNYFIENVLFYNNNLYVIEFGIKLIFDFLNDTFYNSIDKIKDIHVDRHNDTLFSAHVKLINELEEEFNKRINEQRDILTQIENLLRDINALPLYQDNFSETSNNTLNILDIIYKYFKKIQISYDDDNRVFVVNKIDIIKKCNESYEDDSKIYKGYKTKIQESIENVKNKLDYFYTNDVIMNIIVNIPPEGVFGYDKVVKIYKISLQYWITYCKKFLDLIFKNIEWTDDNDDYENNIKLDELLNTFADDKSNDGIPSRKISYTNQQTLNSLLSVSSSKLSIDELTNKLFDASRALTYNTNIMGALIDRNNTSNDNLTEEEIKNLQSLSSKYISFYLTLYNDFFKGSVLDMENAAAILLNFFESDDNPVTENEKYIANIYLCCEGLKAISDILLLLSNDNDNEYNNKLDNIRKIFNYISKIDIKKKQIHNIWQEIKDKHLNRDEVLQHIKTLNFNKISPPSFNEKHHREKIEYFIKVYSLCKELYKKNTINENSDSQTLDTELTINNLKYDYYLSKEKIAIFVVHSPTDDKYI